MEEGAENHGARKRRKPPRGAGAGSDGNNGGDNRGALTGLAAVQGVFHFLPAPADVLRAATACRRWRELACANSVWRARFEREGLLEKAGVFEVALPAVEGGGGSSSSSSSSGASNSGVGSSRSSGASSSSGVGSSRSSGVAMHYLFPQYLIIGDA